MAEQSKLTNSNLCTFTTNESEYSIPGIRCLNSGQISALPSKIYEDMKCDIFKYVLILQTYIRHKVLGCEILKECNFIKYYDN